MPFNFFLHAYGPAAKPTLLLGWVFTIIAVAVCIIILVLLLIAIFHKRAEFHDGRVANDSAEIKWIVTGTGISVFVLFFMAIYSLLVLDKSTMPQQANNLVITVTGYQFWWKVEYDGQNGSEKFETANEIHIPVGIPVMFKLKSVDVIHAFWVPQLAGKTQMIPGITNRQWVQADKPGVYYGKCTQFCGVQHAHMEFMVVAQEKADFEKWEDQQSAAAARKHLATAGEHIFMKQCAGCHTIRGTGAHGDHAPDLTHVASRRMLAAGMMENTPENMERWIQHAQEVKPGSLMPDFKLGNDETQKLTDYLETLN
jgi:cytochrome c oxidase subunit 2